MDRRESAARRQPGLRTVRRAGGPSSPSVDIAYLRPAPGAGPVVLEVAGGPGMAVPLLYARFRRDAVAAGLDVIMVEHRGVGLSRTGTDGRDLPPEAITVPEVVADLVAVLDAEGIDQAIVSGASYGSYVAAALAVRHPSRIRALVLDSALLSAADHRDVRAWSRALLWEGRCPRTAHLARKIRTLVERDGHDELALGAVAGLAFEFGGAPLLEAYLDQVVVGRARWTQRAFGRLLRREGEARVPHVSEMDLVAQIAYGELDYCPEPDGRIFDPAVTLARVDAPAFMGEHHDLVRQLREVTAPAVVISGERDLRTPRPVAERATAALPDAVLMSVPGHGHSALDTRPGLLVEVLGEVAAGRHRGLEHRGREIASRHRPAAAGAVLPRAMRAALAADRLLAPVARTPRGLR